MDKGSKEIQALLTRQGCVWVDGKGWETDGNVNLFCQNLKELPTFSRVGEDFRCHGNNLVSLEGAPTEVGGDFGCSCNQLTSLAGAPREVGGVFYCAYNRLVSLAGAPTKVGGGFWCNDNKLVTLAGAPAKVGGNFWCNKAIKAHPAFEIYWHFVKNGMPELAAKTAAEIRIDPQNQSLN
jgi:hypothetical protein